MMRSKPHEDGPNINIVMQSGVAASEDKVEGKKQNQIHGFEKLVRRMLGLIYIDKKRR